MSFESDQAHNCYSLEENHARMTQTSRIEWLDSFIARVQLAHQGRKIIAMIPADQRDIPQSSSVREAVRVWLVAARRRPIAAQHWEAQFNNASKLLSDHLEQESLSSSTFSLWIQQIVEALSNDATRIVKNRSVEDWRLAFLALLDQQQGDRADGYVATQSLASDLGQPPAVLNRLTEWGTDTGLVDTGPATLIPGSEALKLTPKGSLQLVSARSMALSDGVSVPPKSALWTLDISCVRHAGVKVVLERNIFELAHTQIGGLHTASIVLAGAIGEGVLYDALVQRKTLAMAASAAPKNRGVTKDIETEEWKLYDYVQVAQELGVLKPTTARMAHSVLRDFRNMIHPKMQIDKGLAPDEAEAKASVAWLEALVRDVARAP